MKFGRVIGTVVCTQKDPNMRGVKLLVVQPLSEQLQPAGRAYIAADAVGQAGRGDIVTVVFSADATQAFPVDMIPVDASIVGLVDETVIRRLREEAESV